MTAMRNTAASVMVKLALRMADLPDPMRVDVTWDYTDEDMSDSQWTGKVQVTPDDFPVWLHAFGIDPFSVVTEKRAEHTAYLAEKDSVRVMCLKANES